MTCELYKIYRPKSFDEILGQSAALKSLENKVKKKKCPHAIMFCGPPGCGKTTSARALAKILGATENDISEWNTADVRSMDSIRDIRRHWGHAPHGKARVWILDEAHGYKRDAQDTLLKLLEDPPKHVYIMLVTTDPQKLIEPIHQRCTKIKVCKLDESTMKKLLKKVLKAEKKKVDNEVRDKIIEVADGSPRQALVFLEQCLGLNTVDDQLEVIQKQDMKKQAIELARKLINPHVKWSDVIPILKDLDEDPESVRRMILAYGRSVALGGSGLAHRGVLMIDCFFNPYYDVGAAGLVWSAYQMCGGGKSRGK